MLHSIMAVCVVLFLLPLTPWAKPAAVDLAGVRVINVFSGAPQPTDGPSKYAGFGDVAANLVAAMEIKDRYPEIKVRLLVTSAQHRFDPLIPTTNEILKIMAPELNGDRKDVVQVYKNIEVIFVSYDFAEALNEDNEASLPQIIDDIKKSLPALIPSADVNINFSYFPESAPLLRINSRLAIGVEEQYGSRRPINSLLANDPEAHEAAFIEFASGPAALGFMKVTRPVPRTEARSLINAWAKEAGHTLPAGNFDVGIAYSAGWQSIQIYLHALKEIRPAKPLVLFVKDFPDLDFSVLPPNVQVVRVKGLPHEVMRAIIQEAIISPLVTGDISFGQAMSTVTERKTFVYEAPEWKVESSDGVKTALAADLGLHSSELNPMFLKTEEIQTLSPAQLKVRGKALGQMLADRNLQNLIYSSMQRRTNRWDLLSNTLEIARDALAVAHVDDPGFVKRMGWRQVRGAVNQMANEVMRNDSNRSALPVLTEPRFPKAALLVDRASEMAGDFLFRARGFRFSKNSSHPMSCEMIFGRP